MYYYLLVISCCFCKKGGVEFFQSKDLGSAIAPNIQTMSEQPPVMLPNPCRRRQFCWKMRPPTPFS